MKKAVSYCGEVFMNKLASKARAMAIRSGLFLFLAVALLMAERCSFAATECKIAAGGQALQAVVLPAEASPKLKTLAATLADYLGRMGGAKFEVKEGDGKSGIVLGLASQFPVLNTGVSFDAENDATQREDYLLRSHANGIYLLGATDLAVQDAVWDLLFRLGYRRFFPGPKWEIVPHVASLSVAVDTREHPDYLQRRLWYGFGTWRDMSADKEAWDAANRMGGGLEVGGGHSYESIIKAYKDEFTAHPEYLTNPKSAKLCISNPAVRKIAIDYAIAAFEKDPTRDSVSMDPSDGGGWECTTGACGDDKTYGSITDRVVTLANEVAEAVNKKFKNKYITIYAYYLHAPPPTIKVHPNVVVNIATAYIQGGFTFEQLMDGWRKQSAKLIGVRDYYSVWDGHMDRPAGPGASNIDLMKTKGPKYYALGARMVSAESTESWGAAGLGYYIVSRTLWDSKADPNAIEADFYTRAFGPAEKPMREFYQLINRANQPLFTRNLIGSMYRKLDEARKLTDDPGIRGRLDDLVLWTRYCEMLWDWNVDAPNRKAMAEQILRYAYRWRRSAMIHTYVLFRHSYKLDKNVPAETKFMVPEGKNPWKSNEPIPAEDIENYVKQGIVNNPVIDFKEVQYSHNLVPATKLGLKSEVLGGFSYTRMEQNFYVWIDDASKPLRLEFTGGQIATSATTTFSLHPPAADKDVISEDEDDDDNNAAAGDDDKGGDGPAPPPPDPAPDKSKALADAVAVVDAPNDRTMHVVELKAPAPGLYRLRILDRGRGAGIVWAVGQRLAVESSKKVQTLLRGRNTMYFYVPKGTKVIGGYALRAPTFVDGDGKIVKQLPVEPGFFNIPVPPGQDGKLWRIDRTSITLLMTVPPYLARSADELLLPKEVVDADSK